MRYNLKDPKDLEAALEYLTKLSSQEAMVNITKVNPNRSLRQNAYYHVLLGVYGLATGHTINQAKTIHKRYICPDIFAYEKDGMWFLHSSAEINNEEMTKAIDRLITFGEENGVDMPLATDTEKITYYENLIETQGKWL